MNQNNTCPLNALDNYNILAFGSAIENIPYFHVRLDQSVNPDKLQKAVTEALIQYPHFQTKLHYNKQYFLKKTTRLSSSTMSVLTDVPFIWKRKTTDIYGRSVMTMTRSHSSGVMH